MLNNFSLAKKIAEEKRLEKEYLEKISYFDKDDQLKSDRKIESEKPSSFFNDKY